MSEEPILAARLDVTLPAHVGLARAARTMGAGRGAWLGDPATPGGTVGIPAGMERYLVDLELPIAQRAPLLTFRKAAYLDVGPAVESGDAVSVEISWRAASLAPLFPVFSGHVRWADDTLRLSGVYAPPGGGVGLVADKLLLNVAARGTGRWLLGRILDAMHRQPDSAVQPRDDETTGTDERV